jgi:hypothetical protein
MTIRFAAAQRGDCEIVARILAASVPLRAANDNAWNLARDRVVQGALRHFARHGLAAAQVAQTNAEDAFFAGDRDGYRWWMAICRTLDRRMAGAVAFRADR